MSKNRSLKKRGKVRFSGPWTSQTRLLGANFGTFLRKGEKVSSVLSPAWEHHLGRSGGSTSLCSFSRFPGPRQSDRPGGTFPYFCWILGLLGDSKMRPKTSPTPPPPLPRDIFGKLTCHLGRNGHFWVALGIKNESPGGAKCVQKYRVQEMPR